MSVIFLPQTPLGVEEQISLRSAEVEVASDYTKRRNVLRLATPGGSQLLLQADTQPEMLGWLSTLQNNCSFPVSLTLNPCTVHDAPCEKWT